MGLTLLLLHAEGNPWSWLCLTGQRLRGSVVLFLKALPRLLGVWPLEIVPLWIFPVRFDGDELLVLAPTLAGVSEAQWTSLSTLSSRLLPCSTGPCHLPADLLGACVVVRWSGQPRSWLYFVVFAVDRDAVLRLSV
jgi:hypothetical protein